MSIDPRIIAEMDKIGMILDWNKPMTRDVYNTIKKKTYDYYVNKLGLDNTPKRYVKYRPSNGHEFELFQAKNCKYCIYSGEDGLCEIVGDMFDEKNSALEWLVETDKPQEIGFCVSKEVV